MPVVPKLNKRKTSPIKFGEEKIDKIIKSISEGCPYSIAAESCGMSYGNFKKMILQGNLDMHHNLDTMHSRMVEQIRDNEKTQIKSCLVDIRENQKGHAGAQWILERKFWRHFSSKAETLEMAEEIAEIKSKLEMDSKDTEEKTDVKV